MGALNARSGASPNLQLHVCLTYDFRSQEPKILFGADGFPIRHRKP